MFVSPLITRDWVVADPTITSIRFFFLTTFVPDFHPLFNTIRTIFGSMIFGCLKQQQQTSNMCFPKVFFSTKQNFLQGCLGTLGLYVQGQSGLVWFDASKRGIFPIFFPVFFVDNSELLFLFPF